MGTVFATIATLMSRSSTSAAGSGHTSAVSERTQSPTSRLRGAAEVAMVKAAEHFAHGDCVFHASRSLIPR
jgi:hypothetical protein